LIEGVVALAAGFFSGSVALIGFGVDSFIETASACIVGWRFAYEMRGHSNEQTERAERIASATAGILLLLLAAYLLADSLLMLPGHGREPGTSFAGIVIAGASLLVMPVLVWAKLRTASASRSSALRADAYETITCAWLSLTTLAGLGFNALFGWWRAARNQFPPSA
jgi:divalent metal cation (Fe/Co/Zn/Cd) transporter